MPFKPKHPCRHHGCPALIDADKQYCDVHAPLHAESTERGSSSARGYNRQWQKARKRYLASHPFCVMCLKEGRMTKATVVDHIIPHRGDPDLFWDESNWQPLCKHHHDQKTSTQDMNPVYGYPQKG